MLRVRDLVLAHGLNTVCREARCPNCGECYASGTATFLLMGNRCTRNCRFCAVLPGPPAPLDDGEPERIAEAVVRLGLAYVVLTSVTRDDLPDGGAGHFRETVLAIRRRGNSQVECLIPDFQGSQRALDRLMESRPEVINHNLETIPRLYSAVRPEADYQRSLSIFWFLEQFSARFLTKAGIMVGLGETKQEILAVFRDLRDAGVDVLTIGQYLQPGPGHHPVRRYVHPKEFDDLKAEALTMGFKGVAAGPLVRSSYQAAELYGRAVSREMKKATI